MSATVPLLILALIAVVGVLLLGLFTMARGAPSGPALSQKLMRWRVILQAGALALVLIILAFADR